MDNGGVLNNNNSMPPIPQPDMGSNLNEPSLNEPIENDNMGNDSNMGGFQEPDMGDNQMVGGDENQDPKNEIQKITGELSQKLNDYVSQNQDDSETSKYVLSMIAKQASKNMSDEDKKDVIRKIKSTSNDEDEGLNNDITNLGESKDNIKETFTSALTTTLDKDKEMDKPIKKIRNFNRTSPFFSNR